MGGLLGGGGGTISNEAPMAKGLRIQSSTFGAVQIVCFGRPRISGNLIDYIDFTAIAHTETQTSGGKGGGGVTSSNTSYTYTVGAAIGLCAGPVVGVRRAFSDKEVKTLAELNLTVFTGELNQLPWSYMLSKHPERALSYPYLCYVAGVVNLGDSDSMPNWSFEIDAMCQFSDSIPDANCYDVITELLTNKLFGANYPTERMGDNSLYNNYCIANGFFISPAYTEQQEAASIINDIMMCSNSQPVPSQGKLYFRPYGTETITGNGVTYTPDLTPIFTINDDDYIYRENEDPVKMLRDDTVDRYNFQRVEFLNREDNYSPDVASAPDQASIDRFGLRTAQPVSLHCIADAEIAQTVATNILQRGLYFHQQYEFILPYFPFNVLDPMDIIAINDSVLGLENTLVRIIDNKPDENKEITFTVEEVGVSAGSAAKYARQSADRTAMNYAVNPGNINPPVIFEAPDTLTTTGLEIWIGASGGSVWGACHVWASEDGDTYKRIGKITNPARQGVLAAYLASGSDVDTVNTLSVDMTLSGRELTGGTMQDADNYNTLCFVDGELLAFETATLTGANKYDLEYLRRGAYGTTISSHGESSQFLRIDDAVFKYPFTIDKVGKTLYLKFTSINVYGGGEQSLEDVQVYQYTIKGYALESPLPNPTNLVSYFQNNRTWLKCDKVTDFRAVEYEWRKGSAWNTATVLGTTTDPTFLAMGDGLYWVSARSGTAYSSMPTSILIAGSNIPDNIIATYDELATAWSGIVSGGARLGNFAGSPCVLLTGQGMFSEIPQVSDLTSVLFYGGVASSGAYEIPIEHIVDVGTAKYCQVSISFEARIDAPLTLFSQIQKVGDMASIAGNYSPYGSVIIQIVMADDAEIWGEWQNYVPGQYYGRKFKCRAALKSFDPTVTAYLTGLTFSVDVPDLEQKDFNVSIPAGGTSILYPIPFQVIPYFEITIQNAQEGDTVIYTSQSVNGNGLQIMNSGIGVARTVNWRAKAY